MSHISLISLGHFSCLSDRRRVKNFRTNKVKALLVYLATEQAFTNWPLEHQRQKLMMLLWPDLPTRAAQANLRQTIFHLRRVIPESPLSEESNAQPILVIDRHSIAINLNNAIEFDVAIFRSHIELTRNHWHRSRHTCSVCKTHLTSATSLYRGDFLADFSLANNNPFEEWALLRREQLRRNMLDSLDVLTAACLHQRDYERAQRLARRQLEIDNLRDNAYEQLIEALARCGRRSDALAEYRAYRHVLSSELHAEPAGKVKSMIEVIRADGL